MRRLATLAGVLGTLALPSVAEAAIPNIPNGAGGDITCTVQGGANAGQRHCSGIFTTFDGAPIDINVGFPARAGERAGRRLPDRRAVPRLGRLQARRDLGRLDQRRLRRLLDERPRLGQCRAAAPTRSAPSPCAQNGYNHLMDTRFEVRDAQEIFEALADRAATGATGGEGLIDPQAIGVDRRAPTAAASRWRSPRSRPAR